MSGRSQILEEFVSLEIISLCFFIATSCSPDIEYMHIRVQVNTDSVNIMFHLGLDVIAVFKRSNADSSSLLVFLFPRKMVFCDDLSTV